MCIVCAQDLAVQAVPCWVTYRPKLDHGCHPSWTMSHIEDLKLYVYSSNLLSFGIEKTREFNSTVAILIH